jgi:hypothetical protein
MTARVYGLVGRRIGLIHLVFALLAGCGMGTYYKGVATGAVVVAAQYRALDEADDRKVAAIEPYARTQPARALADRKEWVTVYNKARSAVEVQDDLVIGALREGPAIEALRDNRKEVANWINAITIGAANAAQALRDAGVDWQKFLTGGK